LVQFWFPGREGRKQKLECLNAEMAVCPLLSSLFYLLHHNYLSNALAAPAAKLEGSRSLYYI